MPKHKSSPKKVSNFSFRTGDPPIASKATELAEQARWLFNWVGNRQVFSYSGPGPFDRSLVGPTSPYIQINPDWDYAGDPYFAVITRSQDLTTFDHQLGGVVIPWRFQSNGSISWTPSGGTPSVLFRSREVSHTGDNDTSMTGSPGTEIKLYNGMNDPGVSGGNFSFHKLSYTGIMVAGAGVWSMPDRSLEPEWRKYDLEQHMIGRQVRGYAGTSSRRGLGDLIDCIGELIYRTGRCLLGSGHPVGIYTTSDSYVNLRGDAAPFRVCPIGLYSGDTVEVTPVIVASALGASALNPAYIKYTSVGTTDTCEFTIESDTEALYSQSLGLEIPKGISLLNIEMQAPVDGAVAIRSYSLWEGASS